MYLASTLSAAISVADSAAVRAFYSSSTHDNVEIYNGNIEKC